MNSKINLMNVHDINYKLDSLFWAVTDGYDYHCPVLPENGK